ncbi:hypothetical protein QQF64_003031 [Cirrhinus molitorella]|uniref:Uncharacterized protein n=1 Tax=Cirrhinus molitorella TaxID=172907 RepID=A0ABR3MKP2_9TELE
MTARCQTCWLRQFFPIRLSLGINSAGRISSHYPRRALGAQASSAKTWSRRNRDADAAVPQPDSSDSPDAESLRVSVASCVYRRDVTSSWGDVGSLRLRLTL